MIVSLVLTQRSRTSILPVHPDWLRLGSVVVRFENLEPARRPIHSFVRAWATPSWPKLVARWWTAHICCGRTTIVFGSRGFQPNPTTVSIGIVNVDGTGATPLLPAPAGLPEFFPSTSGGARELQFGRRQPGTVLLASRILHHLFLLYPLENFKPKRILIGAARLISQISHRSFKS